MMEYVMDYLIEIIVEFLNLDSSYQIGIDRNA